MPSQPTQTELIELIHKKFNTNAELDKYEDHEGDKVTIENERDLQEAFNIYYSLKASRPQLLHTLKIYLKKSNGLTRKPSSISDSATSPTLSFFRNRRLSSADNVSTDSMEDQNYLDYHSPMGATLHPNSPSTPPVSFVEYHGGSYGNESSILPSSPHISGEITNTRVRSFSNPQAPLSHGTADYMQSHYGGAVPSSPILKPSVLKSVALVQSGHTSSPVHRIQSMDNVIWKKGQLLGCGGFGSVYLGLLDTGEIIAVKQIEFADPGGDPTLIAKLEEAKQEIEIMKRLHHEHVVQYLGSQIEDNVINIFLE